MRKNLAILLISIHLICNTEAGQFLKLPQLVEHFFQHHRLDPSLSFFEFISMHYYGGDDGTSADDDFDKQLPCHNANHQTTAVAYSPMINEIVSTDYSCWETQTYTCHLPCDVPSEYISLLLRPPRQA